MNSNEDYQGLEIFNVKSNKIDYLERIEYYIKVYPDNLKKDEVLFAISGERAFLVSSDNKLVDETAFYQYLKQSQNQLPKVSGKPVSSNKLKDLIERL